MGVSQYTSRIKKANKQKTAKQELYIIPCMSSESCWFF